MASFAGCGSASYMVIVRNPSDAPLEDVKLTVGGASVPLGKVAPHTEAGVGYTGHLPDQVAVDWSIGGARFSKALAVPKEGRPARLHAIVLVIEGAEAKLVFKEQTPGLS